MTAQISSWLERSKLIYISAADVSGFCRPIPDFFTDNVLRVTTIGGRVLDNPNKRRGKKVPVFLLDPSSHLLSILKGRFMYTHKNSRAWNNLLIFSWRISG